MSARGWLIEPISARHDRRRFNCGFPDLDRFLREFARQNEKKGLTRTYVAVREGDVEVQGFFTVRAGHVEFGDLPPEDRKGLPRHPIPVFHLARLAVARSAQSQRLGEKLLVRALTLAAEVSSDVGMHAVEVLAKDGRARAFYEKYGFHGLPDDRRHMYLPMSTLRSLIPPQ